jgi:hypothetical protein
MRMRICSGTRSIFATPTVYTGIEMPSPFFHHIIYPMTFVVQCLPLTLSQISYDLFVVPSASQNMISTPYLRFVFVIKYHEPKFVVKVFGQCGQLSLDHASYLRDFTHHRTLSLGSNSSSHGQALRLSFPSRIPTSPHPKSCM